MIGIIYKTTNLINLKIYIGSDTKNNGNGDPEYLGSGLLLKKSIEKYGKENFRKEVIDECYTMEELKTSETKNIKLYDSNNRKIGYNISSGYWGGDTLTNHPDIARIREKISIKTLENSYKISKSKKELYLNESDADKIRRKEIIKKSMVNRDISYLTDPEYRNNLSEGLKNSENFKIYNDARIGSKRGKYSINQETHKISRFKKINCIKSENFKKILESLIDKDHSTFSCYYQVYMHIEGSKKIEGLDEFLNYLEENIGSGYLTLRAIKKEYVRLGLSGLKLGKSSVVVKSIYNFKEFGAYPSRIVEYKKIKELHNA
jgi:hypothetical protein